MLPTTEIFVPIVYHKNDKLKKKENLGCFVLSLKKNVFFIFFSQQLWLLNNSFI